MKVVVYLGRVEFRLDGLTSGQREWVEAAWGPFLTPEASLLGDRSHKQHARIWTLMFISQSLPSEIDLSFQRGGDLAIQRIHPERFDDDHRTLNCWIDGSFGSIEASLQVALQWALLEQDGLLIHASAGIWRGEGWLIPGPSGAGKSTSARTAGFDEVLSDELVILLPSLSSASDIPFTLFSTPFWSEGRTLPLVLRAAPLTRITFPIKSASVSLTPCAPIDAITQLVPTLTLYELENSSQRERVFNIACTLCESTPSYWLHFTKVGSWLSELDEANSITKSSL